jgi:hypothetical protein
LPQVSGQFYKITQYYKDKKSKRDRLKSAILPPLPRSRRKEVLAHKKKNHT